MHSDIQVLDLTSNEASSESVAIVFFKQLEGTVHIYRDGTVMLSSPAGTTVTSFQQPDARLWRKTQFLHILTQLGASAQELVASERMIGEQEAQLETLPFATAVEQVANASNRHFQSWCEQQGVDYDQLDEAELEQLLANAIQKARGQ
ncbi:MAG: hypothetical protein U0175_13215 [Caldilineaceae bacterium]